MRNLGLSCALLSLLACDTLHGPVVANSLTEPVQVELDFVDGHRTAGAFPPGSVAHIGNPGGEPTRLRLLTHGQLVAEMSGEDLSAAIKRADEPEFVGWVISQEGLAPLSRDQLKEFRRAH